MNLSKNAGLETYHQKFALNNYVVNYKKYQLKNMNEFSPYHRNILN